MPICSPMLSSFLPWAPNTPIAPIMLTCLQVHLFCRPVYSSNRRGACLLCPSTDLPSGTCFPAHLLQYFSFTDLPGPRRHVDSFFSTGADPLDTVTQLLDWPLALALGPYTIQLPVSAPWPLSVCQAAEVIFRLSPCMGMDSKSRHHPVWKLQHHPFLLLLTPWPSMQVLSTAAFPRVCPSF